MYSFDYDNLNHKNSPTAMVLSGHTMALAVIRALGIMNIPIIMVICNEKEDIASSSKYVSKCINAPNPTEDEDGFIKILLQFSQEYSGSIIFPTSDETLVAVSRHKAILEQHYIVACTEWHITEKFIDKKYTYVLANNIGVPVPSTLVPESVEDIKSYDKKIQYPCLVKPCQSHRYYDHFNRKMTRVNNLEQMIRAYKEAKDADLEIMLQELIPGSDSAGINYNAYIVDGEPVLEFTARKIRNGPPGLGSPRVALAENIPDVHEFGRKILSGMGFYGYACTEFKRDIRDGVYKLMEVNGRHNLSGLLATCCGINFPYIHYNHLTSGVLPSRQDYQKEIYWIDIIRDIGYSILSYKIERYPLKEYIKPYRNPHIFAIYDSKDPKPFFKRLGKLIIK